MKQPVEHNDSDLCLACGMCCNGVLHSEVMVLADEIGLYAPELDIKRYPDQPQFYFELPCRHLGADNRCGIFIQGRPFACEVYVCKLLKEYQVGRRQPEDCLQIIAEARRLTADLFVEQKAEEDVPSTRKQVLETVSEFLAGNFLRHEGRTLGLQTLDAETLHKVARLSFHLQEYFISPNERGVSRKDKASPQ